MRVVRSYRSAVVSGLIVAAMFIATLAAGDAVRIQVREGYYYEPATVRVTVLVPPNAGNRTLRFQADGPMYRASEVMLEGSDAPFAHTFELKGLPSGRYQLHAEVWSANAVRGVADVPVFVLGRGSEPTP